MTVKRSTAMTQQEAIDSDCLTLFDACAHF